MISKKKLATVFGFCLVVFLFLTSFSYSDLAKPKKELKPEKISAIANITFENKEPKDIFTKLIYNKGSMDGGVARFQLCNPTKHNAHSKDFEIYFVSKSDTEIDSYNLYLVENVSKKKFNDYRKEICYPYDVPAVNGSITIANCTILEGKSKVEYIVEEKTPLNQTTTFKKGKCYDLILEASWKPVFGKNYIEWIPELVIKSDTKIKRKFQHHDWAWWNSNYGYRTNETLRFNRSSATDLTNFTFLSNSSYWLNTSRWVADGKIRSDLADLEARESGGAISYEFESYNDSTYGANSNRTLIWARKPTLASDNSSNVSFYYGYASDTTLSNDTNNAWDDNTKLVLHFAQDRVDSSHYNNNASGTGGVTFPAGMFGYGLGLDGTNNALTISSIQDERNISISTAFSIELWFEGDAYGGTRKVLSSKADGGYDDEYNLWVTTTPVIQWRVFNTLNTNYDCTGSDGLGTNTWYHLVCIMDGTAMKCYLNGNLECTQTFSGTLDIVDNPTYIGSMSDGAWDFDGTIDEFRIYDKVLTEDEIRRNYENRRVINVWGQEETAPLPPNAIPNYVQCVNNTKDISCFNDRINVTYNFTGGGANSFKAVNRSDTNIVDTFYNEWDKYSDFGEVTMMFAGKDTGAVYNGYCNETYNNTNIIKCLNFSRTTGATGSVLRYVIKDQNHTFDEFHADTNLNANASDSHQVIQNVWIGDRGTGGVGYSAGTGAECGEFNPVSAVVCNYQRPVIGMVESSLISDDAIYMIWNDTKDSFAWSQKQSILSLQAGYLDYWNRWANTSAKGSITRHIIGFTVNTSSVGNAVEDILNDTEGERSLRITDRIGTTDWFLANWYHVYLDVNGTYEGKFNKSSDSELENVVLEARLLDKNQDYYITNTTVVDGKLTDTQLTWKIVNESGEHNVYRNNSGTWELVGNRTTSPLAVIYNASIPDKFSLLGVFPFGSDVIYRISEYNFSSIIAVYPQWSSNQTQRTFPRYYATAFGETNGFSINFTDAHTVYIETNYSGTKQNITALNDTPTVFYRNFSLPATNFTIKWFANSTTGHWNSSDEWVYNYRKEITPLDMDFTMYSTPQTTDKYYKVTFGCFAPHSYSGADINYCEDYPTIWINISGYGEVNFSQYNAVQSISTDGGFHTLKINVTESQNRTGNSSILYYSPAFDPSGTSSHYTITNFTTEPSVVNSSISVNATSGTFPVALQPYVYKNATTIAWLGVENPSLWYNNTSTSYSNITSLNNSAITFPAGSIRINSTLPSNRNITGTNNSILLSISRSYDQMNLTFNGTQGNVSYLNNTGEIVNITGWSNSSYGNIALWDDFNGTLLQMPSAGTNPATNTTNVSLVPAGTYLIRANLSASQNYTGGTISYYMTVTFSYFFIIVLDETTDTAITFNITISNTTTSVSYQNQNPLFQPITSIPTNSLTMHISSNGYGSRYFYLTGVNHSIIVNQTYYLLSTTEGDYKRFHILSINNNPIEDALVSAYKPSGAIYVLVEQAYSDSSGTSNFFLDEDTVYKIITNKTGYEDRADTIQPTLDDYYIYMTPEQYINYTESVWDGVSYEFTPSVSRIENTTHNFTFYIVASDLTEYGMNISNSTHQLYSGNLTNATGGTIWSVQNLYYQANESTINVTAWFVRIGFSKQGIIKIYTVYWRIPPAIANYTEGNATTLKDQIDYINEGGYNLDSTAFGIIAIICTLLGAGLFAKAGETYAGSSHLGAGIGGLIVLGLFTFVAGWFAWELYLAVAITVVFVEYLIASNKGVG